MRWLIHGFFYWAAFLLVLEPDNVIRAVRAGHRLSFDHEAVRITAAASMGAAVTPLLLWMTSRFPMSGTDRWRHGLFHVVGTAGAAFALIVISCFVAAWGFERHWIPSLTEVRDQLARNWTLLMFALSFFTAIAHAVRFSPKAGGLSQAPIQTQLLTRIPVKSKGRLSYIDIASVDWVETQGNYLALHVGARTHLIRDTLARLETELDPDRFVRIHRRTIVAVDRIKDIRAEGNGDATLRLFDGRELRASRPHRKAIRERWTGTPE
jgi:hypothetical protein